MTTRERMLAVIQGREHDRVPFAMYEILLPYEEVHTFEPLADQPAGHRRGDRSV